MHTQTIGVRAQSKQIWETIKIKTIKKELWDQKFK